MRIHNSDTAVKSAILDSVSDHAYDEARHHRYCADLLKAMWPQLSRRQRRLVAIFIPKFVTIFVEPNRDAVSRELLDCGLKEDDVSAIIQDVYSREAVERSQQESAKALIGYCLELGM